MTVIYWSIFISTLLFFLCGIYRLFYLFVPFFTKKNCHGETVIHRIGILVAAKDEETALPFLLESIRRQDYPTDMLSVYVVADNCSDHTAEVARTGGATVFVRTGGRRTGKGYALNYLVGEIGRTVAPEELPDAYIVCDADNILSSDYVSEINKTYSDGFPVVSGCRNIKNFGESWISSAFGIYFLYDSQFLNRSRMRIGRSAFVAGTGYLVDRLFLEEGDGWVFLSMADDTELTAECLTRKVKVGYAEDAVLYDEQPTTMRESVRQRKRWCRGHWQTLVSYGARLFRQSFRFDFSSTDLLLSMFFFSVFALIAVASAYIGATVLFFMGAYTLPVYIAILFSILAGIYVIYVLLGLYTVLLLWGSIRATAWQKIRAVLLYPFFIAMQIPFILTALFTRATWQPFRHSSTVRVEEVMPVSVNETEQP